MPGESPKETREEQVESLIDDLIHDIFNESGASESSAMRGMATTALLESAFGSGRSTASMLEQVLVARYFASELADVLAPALADQLAPRLLKSLEGIMADEATRKKPASASGSRAGGPTRKSEAK